MAGFDAVHEQIDKDLSSSSSPEETQDSSSEVSETTKDVAAEKAQAIFDLDKAEKFRFDGKEMTRKELDAYIMRQKDYTQKTQGLSEERKTLESERKYYDNLYWDLQNVKANPALAQEFIKVYPEKFHSYLENVLKNTQGQVQDPAQRQNMPDVATLSRLERIEKGFFEQEVSKVEAEIDRQVQSLSKKYEFANRDSCLAKAYEFHQSLPVDPITGRKALITADTWDKIFSSDHQANKAFFDGRYKELIKKQTTANAKAADVGSGGGVPGQAPKKFDPKRGFKDLHKEVISAVTSSKQ